MMRSRSLVRCFGHGNRKNEARTLGILLQEAFFLSILRLQDKFDSGTLAMFTDILGSSKGN